jgi:hypothetical protein
MTHLQGAESRVAETEPRFAMFLKRYPDVVESRTHANTTWVALDCLECIGLHGIDAKGERRR